MTPSLPTILTALHALKERATAPDAPRSRYDFSPCETAASIAAIEQKTGFPVPPDLKHILLTLGGFSIDINIDGFALTFTSRPGFPHPVGGLVDVLDAKWCWEDYRDSDDFPDDDIARMNADFVCFGHCEVDQNSADHFFYDRNGHYGVLLFDQEFRNRDANNYLFELCEGENTRAPLTLEEMLAPHLAPLI